MYIIAPYDEMHSLILVSGAMGGVGGGHMNHPSYVAIYLGNSSFPRQLSVTAV